MYPVDKIAALFGDHPPQLSTKRGRKRLSDNNKIDSDVAALEGVHATRRLLLVVIMPAIAISNPAMHLVINSLNFAVEKIESCASALELACTHTSAKNVPSALIES